MRELNNIFYYLLLSITAIILILIMVLAKPITTNTNNYVDKFFVAGIFFISCLFGISIAIYPSWWKKNKQKTNHTPNLKRPKTSRIFQGHHPNCSIFKNHIIIIKNKPRCAGCLGLILGALASILLITLYLILPLKLSINIYYFLLILGIIVLIFVYGEIILSKRKMFFHILLNSLLILSFLTITISVLEITKNLIYAILTVILCFLWLDTRIYISNHQHQRICDSCAQECKSY
ncbi:MAG: hypothetical protein MUO82_02100 [Candidatus Thermoplasmatota archaeon]|nr:hypothetical protein [Candidatus Thermoplasmatota archaeon]